MHLNDHVFTRRGNCGAISLVFLACLIALLCQPCEATVLPATISANRTLTAAGSPWQMRGNVTITPGATVTVEPNAHVVAEGNVRLTVSGSLIAMSPAGTRIVFRAPDSSASGAWQGIYFTPGSTGRFQRCTFRSATTNLLVEGADVRLYNCHVRKASQDGLMAWGDAFVKTAYCRFQNNTRHGLQIQTNSPSGAVISSEFIGNGGHPVLLKASCVELLRAGNRFEYNGTQAIGVDCDALADIEDADSWVNPGLPLDMAVGSPNAELRIEPGATLRIAPGTRIYPPHRIVVRGSLILSGSQGPPAVIQPQGAAQPGAWVGVAVEPQGVVRADGLTLGFAEDGLSVSDGSIYLANAMIRDCSRNGVFAGGTAHVDMTGCTVSACGMNGIAMPQGSSSAKIRTTRIVRCGEYPVRMAATVVEGLRDGNSAAENGRQAIGVVCSTYPDIADDDLWQAQGIPFDLTADPTSTSLRIGVTGRLSLREGVKVLGGVISAGGVFVAQGTAATPVIFDAATDQPAPGDWTGIEYATGSSGRLVHARVRNARIGVNVQSDGWIQLRNTLVERCAEDGIRAGSGSVPLITGCTVRDNARYGVSVWADATPLLGVSGSADNPGLNVLTGNGEHDLANQTPRALVAQRNWWGTTAQAQIGARILDRSESASLGPVNFTPFLQSAPTTAPATLESRTTLAITSVAAMPTGAGAAIHVALTRPAEVRVTLRNIAGRPVRMLSAFADTQATLAWDGRATQGTSAPSGRYLVEVEALADDGSLSHALTTLQLTR